MKDPIKKQIDRLVRKYPYASIRRELDSLVLKVELQTIADYKRWIIDYRK